MPADPTQLDLATRLGAWLATYWVHAAIAIGATWLLVRTALRHAPASTRALAWRAAMVVPLVTSVARSEWIERGPRVEVDWLGRTQVARVDGGASADADVEPVTTDAAASTASTNAEVRHADDADALDATVRNEHGALFDSRSTQHPNENRSSAPSHSPAEEGDASVATAPGPFAGIGVDERSAGRRTHADSDARTARTNTPFGPSARRASGTEDVAEGDGGNDSVDAEALLAAASPFDADATSSANDANPIHADSPAPLATNDAFPAPFGAIDPRRLALLVAAAAAVLALARWLDGWLRLGRTLGRREPLPPELAERAARLANACGVPHTPVRASATARVPMAFGFLRPQVCVPRGFEAGLTRSEWDAAIAHELAHVVRGDTRWLPGLRLLARILSFQPLNRVAWRELERESEHAADEFAVGVVGSSQSLALCLAKVATRATGDRGVLPAAAVTGAPTMAARASLVLERTERLLSGRFSGGRAQRRHVAIIRIAAVLPTLLVALAAPRFAPSTVLDSGPAPSADAIDATAFDRDAGDGDIADRALAEERALLERLGRSASIDTATPVPSIASTRPSAADLERSNASNERQVLLDDLASGLEAELAATRVELERARASLAPEHHPRLDDMAHTLDRLDTSFTLVLELIGSRLDEADRDEAGATAALPGDATNSANDDHGSDARANAADPDLPSPTTDPEGDHIR